MVEKKKKTFMPSVELEGWIRKEAESESRESVRLWSCVNAIDSPMSQEEGTVLDCRSRRAAPLPW